MGRPPGVNSSAEGDQPQADGYNIFGIASESLL
jgi:hypothetical protein